MAVSRFLYFIASMDEEQGLGKQNKIPWRSPSDLKRFQALTLGHTLLMGRKTWESLPRALPGRKSIICTRDEKFQAQGAEILKDPSQILERAKVETIYVIGGQKMYEYFSPFAAKLFLSFIPGRYACDAFFPPILKENYPLEYTETLADHKFSIFVHKEIFTP